MKILLISPVKDTQFRTNKGLMMQQLALFIIEGLTPKKHQVKIVEEEYMHLNLDEECDLVGISCMTSNANRAYHLATEFKKRGKTVILGGVHPTILPDEALKYADSIVIGEAEGVWETLLEDFQNNRLQRSYHNATPDIKTYVPKNFSSLKSKRLFNVIPIMTTRGCPYNCEFCCVTNLYGKQIRHVPIENVVRDIKESKSKNFMFLDDNIIGDTRYAKELFQAIKPLNISWVGQASISFVKDTELMKLAAESGCNALFFGLESVSKIQIMQMRKSIKDLSDLEDAIQKIKKFKIIFHASMIFGFDNDTKEIFQETYDFLMKNKIGTVSFNILTPYPGTKVYDDFKAAGRLLTDDWKYYDHNTVVFKPINMTPWELQKGKTEIKSKFYSLSSFIKRAPGNLYRPLIYIGTNVGHRMQLKIEKKRLTWLEKVFFNEEHSERNEVYKPTPQEVNTKQPCKELILK